MFFFCKFTLTQQKCSTDYKTSIVKLLIAHYCMYTSKNKVLIEASLFRLTESRKGLRWQKTQQLKHFRSHFIFQYAKVGSFQPFNHGLYVNWRRGHPFSEIRKKCSKWEYFSSSEPTFMPRLWDGGHVKCPLEDRMVTVGTTKPLFSKQEEWWGCEDP